MKVTIIRNCEKYNNCESNKKGCMKINKYAMLTNKNMKEKICERKLAQFESNNLKNWLACN
jgi:hypothetical protein